MAVYVDNVIISSEGIQEHLETLEEIFRRFRAAGVRINKDKSRFLQKSIKFLGRIFDGGGMSPSNEYSVKIQDWPTPSTGRQLRQFLGLVWAKSGPCYRFS